MFRKILKWAGIFLVGLIVLFIAAAIWTAYSSTKYEKTAVPYIEKVIPEISTWDPEILKSYMSESVVSEINDEEIVKLMSFFSKLGYFESTDPPQFQSVNSSATTQHGAMTLVTYLVPTYYEAGEATIVITLEDIGDSFKIFEFRLNSVALME